MAENIEEAGALCLRCGHANFVRASRCAECNAPLDDFASTAPWEMNPAMGQGYPSSKSHKRKPIIFFGAWLYFGPGAIIAFWHVVVFISEIISGSRNNAHEGAGVSVSEIVLHLVLVLFGAVSLWVLWHVSKSYFNRQ